MGLFNKRINYKPFEYPEIMDFVDRINKTFWTHSEVEFTSDIQDFKAKLSPLEKDIVRKSLLSIAQVEVAVKLFWGKIYDILPKPEINNLGATFAECEVRHGEAYSRLLEVNGLNNEFDNIYSIPIFKKKIDMMDDYMTPDKDIIFRLMFFTIVIENASLFSQFANILSFTRFRGLLKNTSNIIAWTSIDEVCLKPDVLVLTPQGWRKISEVQIGDEVFGFNEGKLKIEKVLDTVKYPFNGDLIRLSNSKSSVVATPSHKMFYVDDNGGWHKVTLENLPTSTHAKYPHTVELVSDNTTEFTDEHKLFIALQADGCRLLTNIGNLRGKNGGYNWRISVLKGRKVDNLKNILENLSYKYSISLDDKKYVHFSISIPNEVDYKEFSSWVDLSKVNKQWCEQFVEELVLWDGSKSGGTYIYSSTNKDNIDIAQAIGFLAGYRCTIRNCGESEIKDTYKDCYKVSFYNKDSFGSISHSYKKEKVPYKGDVHCITVPSGGIVVKSFDEIQGRDNIFITGNCHAEAGTWLINKVMEEYPEYRKFIPELVEATKEYLQYEEELLDWIYENGELEFFSKQDMLNFMKYRVDKSLVDMGIDRIYNITEEQYKPMAWFDEEVFGNEIDDFFAKRPTAYTKHDKPITSDNIF